MINTSIFKNWWFFDTNCISELIKISRSGNSDKVNRFISQRNILIPSHILQELIRRPDIFEEIEFSLRYANIYMIPDITKFWYTDIFSYLNVLNLESNTLNVIPMKYGFSSKLINNVEFNQICKESEENIRSVFLSKIEPDIGSTINKYDIGIYIWQTINKYSNEWFSIEIPNQDCNAKNFPSFYVYFYTYFYRYIDSSTVKPEINDFIDLSNCLAAPYCEKFFAEKKFTNVLNLRVKGFYPPTPYQLIKRLYNKGIITKQIFQEINLNKNKFNTTTKLLDNTNFYNFSDLQKQVFSI